MNAFVFGQQSKRFNLDFIGKNANESVQHLSTF